MVDFVSKMIAQVGGWDPNPANWNPIYEQASKAYNVPVPLLKALVHTESGGSTSADSPKGNKGPTQLGDTTAGGLGVVDSRDPREAIPAAAKYLAQGYAANGNSWEGALKYYYGGPDQKQWGPNTDKYPIQVAKKLAGLGVDPGDFGLSQVPQATSGIPTITIHAPPGSVGQPAPMDFVSRMTRQIDGAPDEAKAMQALQNAKPPSGQESGSAPAAVAKGVVPSLMGLGVNGQPTPSPSPTTPPSGMAPGSIPTPTSAPVGQWGPLESFANGVALGFGPQLRAAGAGLESGLSSLVSGGGVGPSLQAAAQAYGMSLPQILAARSAWEGQNPGMAGLTQIAGSMAPSMLGTGVVNAGARAVGGMVANELPTLAPAVDAVGRLLGGTLGTGKSTGPIGALANFAGRRIGDVASGATQGALMGAIQSGMGDQPTSQSIGTGAMLGGGLSAVLGPAGRVISKAAFPTVEPGMAKLAQTPEAQSLGIRGGQIAQGKIIKTLDRLLGSHTNEAQLENFTKLAASTLGGTPQRLTSDVFADLRKAIGRKLNAFAQQHGVTIDDQLLNDLSTIRKDVLASALEEPKVKVVTNALNRLEDHALLGLANGAKLSGKDYQEITRFHGSLSQLANDSDNIKRLFGVRMRKALDDALERSVTPDELSALKTARGQWFNSIVLDPLVAKAQPTGVIDPKQLEAAVRSNMKDYSWRQPSQLVSLGQLGKLLTSPTAQGDTAKAVGWRQLAHDFWRYGSIPATAVAAGHFGLEVPAAIAGTAAAGGALGLRMALTSPAYRNRLAQIGLGQAQIPSAPNALLPLVNQLYLPNNNLAR